MPGVRIQHPTARSVTYTLTDGHRPYRTPLVCMAQLVIRGELRPCGRTHTHKTYHLALDETGAAVVSETIAARLRSIPGQPFAFTNAVARPPDLTVRVPLLTLRPRAHTPGV